MQSSSQARPYPPNTLMQNALVTPQSRNAHAAEPVPGFQPVAVNALAETGQLRQIQPSLPKIAQKYICNVSSFKEGQIGEDRYLEYLNQIHEQMKGTEELFMPRRDFLQRQGYISAKDREIMTNWLIMLQVQFKLLPETLFISVNIMDRFLSIHTISKKKFQLLGVASMLIASKFQEIYPPIISDFIHMCSNAFSHAEIQQMEAKVLTAVQFDVNCTPS